MIGQKSTETNAKSTERVNTIIKSLSKFFKRVLWLPQALYRKNDYFKKFAIFDLWGILFHRFDLVVKAESGVGAIVRMFWILDQKIGLRYFRFNPILK